MAASGGRRGPIPRACTEASPAALSRMREGPFRAVCPCMLDGPVKSSPGGSDQHKRRHVGANAPIVMRAINCSDFRASAFHWAGQFGKARWVRKRGS